MISDYYSLEGTKDARCPDLGHTWVWNDWRPVTGENSWACLIGPLQLAYFQAEGDVNLIPDMGSSMQLALDYLPALKVMQIASIGAIYYAPYNTWDQLTDFLGSTVSTENNASTLAALRMLYEIISRRKDSAHKGLLADIRALIVGIERFLKTSYSKELGYFRQGGSYDTISNTFTWVKEPFFAVDCQSWTLAVLGATVVDEWYGKGTAAFIWNTTKILGGYQYNTTTQWTRGLGYSDNREVQVFSGEWSLGAVAMLRVLANETNSSAMLKESEFMYQAVIDDLRVHSAFPNNVGFDAIVYANKRYYIPFGWWANSVPAMASTAWADMLQHNFNPLYLGGAFKPWGLIPPAW